jgi:polyphenol oxidase
VTTAPWLGVDLGPGVRAGFSTTALGNVGLTVGDEAAAAVRREQVAEWASGPVAWARQVHGAEVCEVLDRGAAPSADVGECDAMVTASTTGLAVVVADCVPVLLADPVARVIGTAHAGRRGLLAGVVPAVIAQMRRLGARDLRAVVGPAICGSCYEVPEQMRDAAEAVVPGTASLTSWGTPALDVPAGVVSQLVQEQVQVTRLDICTRTDDRFYSHRRHLAEGVPAGRIAGVVRLHDENGRT